MRIINLIAMCVLNSVALATTCEYDFKFTLDTAGYGFGANELTVNYYNENGTLLGSTSNDNALGYYPVTYEFSQIGSPQNCDQCYFENTRLSFVNNAGASVAFQPNSYKIGCKYGSDSRVEVTKYLSGDWEERSGSGKNCYLLNSYRYSTGIWPPAATYWVFYSGNICEQNVLPNYCEYDFELHIDSADDYSSTLHVIYEDNGYPLSYGLKGPITAGDNVVLSSYKMGCTSCVTDGLLTLRYYVNPDTNSVDIDTTEEYELSCKVNGSTDTTSNGYLSTSWSSAGIYTCTASGSLATLYGKDGCQQTL